MAGRHILVINAGSSSLKFALVNEAQAQFPIQGLAERLGSAEATLHWQEGNEKHSRSISNATHTEALAQLLPLVEAVAGGKISGVGHRVVHGGEDFTTACLIDQSALAAINANTPLAPLHNPANLQGIAAVTALYPELPQVAVFDTAFHQTMPDKAYRYALPETLYREHGVRRYGFHGTSHQYVSTQAAKLAELSYDNSSWLVAHLGNGCSTCAVLNGRSVDTSMGMTPLEGLVMGTRSGDVDPNLHSHLARTLGWSLNEIDRMLNQDSGLLGLSGLSNDMRQLEAARADGHLGATLAIDVFCYRLAKSLAALSCALPSLDGLVFTGGIGENSSLIRAKTVAQLGLLNLHINDDANANCIRGKSGLIQQSGSRRILVVPTNEERQIAIEALALLNE